MNSLKRLRFAEIRENLIQFWMLASAALCMGLLVNQFRDEPMALTYQSKQQRLDAAASHLATESAQESINREGANARLFMELPEKISLTEFQAIVTQKNAKVFDARPEIFYRVGHVPGSRSLPRDDFEKYYRKYQSELEATKNQPLVVYCSGTACEDSRLVATTLKKMGYTNIAIFPGGWSAWGDAGLPQETGR